MVVQWLILVLYGITGALFAYVVSLITSSPLAAFAIAAAYQIIMFTVSNLPKRRESCRADG
jgi:ATP-binding cassette subfamily A (ABC1) protein 3